MEDSMELGTLQNLIRERDRYTDILELLENGDIEKAKEKLKRNIESINEAIENK